MDYVAICDQAGEQYLIFYEDGCVGIFADRTWMLINGNGKVIENAEENSNRRDSFNPAINVIRIAEEFDEAFLNLIGNYARFAER